MSSTPSDFPSSIACSELVSSFSSLALACSGRTGRVRSVGSAGVCDVFFLPQSVANFGLRSSSFEGIYKGIEEFLSQLCEVLKFCRIIGGIVAARRRYICEKSRIGS